MKPAISVVVPLYNDEMVVQKLLKKLEKVLSSSFQDYEIILVDDGSTDTTFSILSELSYLHLKIIKLTRNFGQSNAIVAGLSFAIAENIVIMDSDLQDKPEDIPLLYNALISQNIEMVIATRKNANEHKIRNFLSRTFFRFSDFFATIKVPANTGVFRIIKSSCLINILQKPYQSGSILSQLYQAKTTYVTLPLARDVNVVRQSNYTYMKMIKLAITRLIAFSRVPFPKKIKDKYIPNFEIEIIVEKL
ncbi:MAG: glycosyltransferase [Candidatus Cloacimonetes bacterium]|jgi:polyisoprenyl-phosphate glycosyltransferase|nr:glycosyltransferase [Candidatus Cloacimonadota bacterium]MBT6993791.1 glycosyltransferase [Candidatus Cloacimonadota bacterium]MBT7470175.1 glycosyltransferase [Candidatus Cloacimonadota bacterium]